MPIKWIASDGSELVLTTDIIYYLFIYDGAMRTTSCKTLAGADVSHLFSNKGILLPITSPYMGLGFRVLNPNPNQMGTAWQWRLHSSLCRGPPEFQLPLPQDKRITEPHANVPEKAVSRKRRNFS
jgi:hypothetical protein